MFLWVKENIGILFLKEPEEEGGAGGYGYNYGWRYTRDHKDLWDILIMLSGARIL